MQRGFDFRYCRFVSASRRSHDSHRRQKVAKANAKVASDDHHQQQLTRVVFRWHPHEHPVSKSRKVRDAIQMRILASAGTASPTIPTSLTCISAMLEAMHRAVMVHEERDITHVISICILSWWLLYRYVLKAHYFHWRTENNKPLQWTDLPYWRYWRSVSKPSHRPDVALDGVSLAFQPSTNRYNLIWPNNCVGWDAYSERLTTSTGEGAFRAHWAL